MSIHSMPCTEQDIARLVAFTAELHPRDWQPVNLHSGDILWAVYRAPGFDFSRIRLWQDDNGALIGFGWMDAPGEVCLQIAPSWYGRGVLEDAMLAWAREHTVGASLAIRSLAGDPLREPWLAARGFVHDEASSHFVAFRRELTIPIPDEAPPPGFVVRPVGDESEWQERVELHREVWHRSKVTLEAYRHFRGVAGYTPELDVVAVAPDGALAAYAICWQDPTTRIGIFEPVGTRLAYRGQHIGRAVMLEGLRRLRGAGMRSATVMSASENPAALRLYQSVGFVVVGRDYLYREVKTHA